MRPRDNPEKTFLCKTYLGIIYNPIFNAIENILFCLKPTQFCETV